MALSGAGFYARVAELQGAGFTFAIATVTRAQGSVPRHAGTKMIVLSDGSIEGTVGGGDLENRVIEAALESVRTGRPKALHYEFRDIERGDVGVCGGEMEVYVEPVKPEPTLIVVGAGHVGQAVAHLGNWLGFRVVVADDRPEFAESAPDADERLSVPLVELPQITPITSDTYVLLTTRGIEIDIEGLPALLDTEAAYIGVIGSRRRWDVTAEKLAEAGVDAEKIGRVRSPIGLELNAETPEEIAVSMLAEIIMLRRGGTGEAMAHTPGAAG